jgi:hypothetical protein
MFLLDQTNIFFLTECNCFSALMVFAINLQQVMMSPAPSGKQKAFPY